MLASVVSDFWHFFYAPAGHRFWEGAVWGNIVAVSILAPGAYLWAKSKFWPLRPIRAALSSIHAHSKHQTMLAEELHHLAHTGEPHPRVVARTTAGQHSTPAGP